jgi:mannose-6-phosphate isomerase-like protein (cupin superfamily)
MAGRVIDLDPSPAALGEGGALFEGEHLGLVRRSVPPGARLRLSAGEREEQVWLALSGRGRYRPDPMAEGAPGEPFVPGQAAVLREGEWAEVECVGDRPLELVGVAAPQPGTTA